MYKSKEGILISLAIQTIERVKNKIREFTFWGKPVSMAGRIRRIDTYLVDGWDTLAWLKPPASFRALKSG